MSKQSLVEMTSVPGVPHRGREMDREHGGVICSDCGWSLAGPFLDTETQIRHHQEYVDGLS